jgi:hypothetical protein
LLYAVPWRQELRRIFELYPNSGALLGLGSEILVCDGICVRIHIEKFDNHTILLSIANRGKCSNGQRFTF